MVMVNQFNLELEQMDVNTAFLNGDLEETIYMEHPEGFMEENSNVSFEEIFVWVKAKSYAMVSSV